MIEVIQLFFTDAAYFKSAMITFFDVAFALLFFSPVIAVAVFFVVGIVRNLFNE